MWIPEVRTSFLSTVKASPPLDKDIMIASIDRSPRRMEKSYTAKI